MRRLVFAVLCMVGCVQAELPEQTEVTVIVPPVVPPVVTPPLEIPLALGAWDALVAAPCEAIDTFEAEVTQAGLDGFAISEEELAGSHAGSAGLIGDYFRTSHLLALRAEPQAAGCFEARAAGTFDAMSAGQHLVSSAIRHAAVLADASVQVDPFAAGIDFDRGLEELCEAAKCGASEGELPGDLRAALGPVLAAIAAGLDARAERDASQVDGGKGADWWRRWAGTGLVFEPNGQGYDSQLPIDLSYLHGDRSGIYGAAARIAHAIESIDWSRFKGRRDVRFDLLTSAGAIRVRDSRDDEYQTSEPTLLLLDLGGDDVHRDEVASNLSGANAVSIAIDLAGDDDYGYDADRDDARFSGSETFGAISLSTAFRQGAARNGIAMLFDLEGDDTYRSLRGSQGYAHHGVGVLFDRKGDDEYRAEATSQGAAQFGIGILIDLEGEDEYRSVYASQGLGFVGGVGIAFDSAGDDEWRCDEGSDGDDLYRSPQLPGRANTSLCQGAGFGLRSDDPAIALSGGLGLLVDRDGDDEYSAAVYAQGVGYWQGVGLLSDRAGDDRYESLYYAQGAGVHYAAGVLVDHGGDDERGATLRPEGYSLGAGYDYSVGVLLDLAGRDDVRFRGISVGGAAENALGLFLDRDGDDHYRGGRGGRSSDRGRALMIDRAGADAYED